jgi:hypothetical protein
LASGKNKKIKGKRVMDNLGAVLTVAFAISLLVFFWVVLAVFVKLAIEIWKNDAIKELEWKEPE